MHCVNFSEGADPHAWSDNYLCSPKDLGLRWSNAGPRTNESCIAINEPSDPHTWSDNYLCRAPLPSFKWSNAGPLAGMRCVQFTEAADPDTWNDNYLCDSRDWGLRWSSTGPLPQMHCIQIREPADPHAWGDNYLCSPEDMKFEWSFAGPVPGKSCAAVREPADNHGWNDNFLCWSALRATASLGLRLGFFAPEATYYTSHRGEFPVSQRGADYLQIYVEDKSDTLMRQVRESFRTPNWMEEWIFGERIGHYNEDTDPVHGRLASLVNRIRKVEASGMTVSYFMAYREPFANLPAGPWADKRLLAPEDLAAYRETLRKAHERGLVKRSSYPIYGLITQFAELDGNARNFIQTHLDGLALEVNSHDYSGKSEHVDAAIAAVWAKSARKPWVITSGAGGTLDTAYKPMMTALFNELRARKLDPADPSFGYVMHHNSMSYAETLPEWNPNTVTENFAWLVREVKGD
jgi:hypothetical protein